MAVGPQSWRRVASRDIAHCYGLDILSRQLGPAGRRALDRGDPSLARSAARRDGDAAPAHTRRRQGPGVPLALAVVGLVLMGFNSIRLADYPIADIVFFALAGVLWLMLLSGRVSRLSSPSVRASSARLLVAIMAFLAMATVSSFRSWYPRDSILVVTRLGYLTVLWFWMMRCISLDRRAIALLLRGWRWGVLISCAGAIAANAGLVTLGRPNPENRQAAWFYHPNDLGGFIAVAIPLFVFAAPRLAMTAKHFAGARWLGAIGVSVFALSTTGSISGALGAAAGVAASGIVLLLTRQPSGRRVHPLKTLAVIAAIGVGGIALLTSDMPVVDRVTRYQSGDTSIAGSVGTRGELNERVITRFDDLLVVGNGLDPKAQDDLRGTGSGVHNMYVKMLYEAGLPAALALLAMFAVMLSQGWKLLVNMRSTEVYLDLVAVFGSAVAGMTFAFFQPTTSQRYFWMPFAMIQCFWVVRRAELRAQVAERTASGRGGRPVASLSSAARASR